MLCWCCTRTETQQTAAGRAGWRAGRVDRLPMTCDLLWAPEVRRATPSRSRSGFLPMTPVVSSLDLLLCPGALTRKTGLDIVKPRLGCSLHVPPPPKLPLPGHHADLGRRDARLQAFGPAVTWSCALLGLELRQGRLKGDQGRPRATKTAARGESALVAAVPSRHRMRPLHLVPVWLVWSSTLGRRR